ncbi:MAG: hypothetical protein EXS05_18030 [Planctomycetaceae bacterium]|nr:hypothetical protein [Planctomycetaceae bacterium]
MVAAAAEGAIEAHVVTVPGYIERDAALGGPFLQGGLCLRFVDADVSGAIHRIRGGKAGRNGTLPPRQMANNLILSERDRALLRLLSWTPATTTLLLKASSTFAGGPFLDERRLRERLQALAGVGFIRWWASAHAGGGLQNYYKLTPAGFQTLEGVDAVQPPKAFFAEISPSLFEHTMQLTEVIVATLRGCHEHHVAILRIHRENDLTFAVGDRMVQPDCFFRFASGGKNFSVAFEVDLSTESVDSPSFHSIRRKLQTYDAYQAMVLSQWVQYGKTWERPRFRVAFLTRSIDRAIPPAGRREPDRRKQEPPAGVRRHTRCLPRIARPCPVALVRRPSGSLAVTRRTSPHSATSSSSRSVAEHRADSAPALIP